MITGKKPARYVGFESLMLTARVVTRRKNWLLVSTAGDNPRRFWLEFDSKYMAQRAGGSLLIHLREKRARGELYSDYQYNQIISAWMEQLLDGGYVLNRRDDGGRDNANTESD